MPFVRLGALVNRISLLVVPKPVVVPVRLTVAPGFCIRLLKTNVLEAPAPVPLVELTVEYPPARINGPTVSRELTPAVLLPRNVNIPPLSVTLVDDPIRSVV